MNSVTIVFPHQLFKESPALHQDRPVYLVEEFLLFKHYSFHKQKIAFHRASMRFYKDHLESIGFQVEYIDASKSYADVRKLLPELKARGIDQIHCTDPVDYWLEKRLMKEATKAAIEIKFYDSPLFLNRSDELSRFFKEDKKKYYQTSFYKQERQKRKILIDKEENPEGGKWTYDTENRKKYPAKKTPPAIQYPDVNDYFKEARLYVEKNFSKNLGTLSEQLLYPTTYKTTEEWLDQFLKNRFHEFGTYEDAIVADDSILHHSVLTPMMNVGLITPKEVINRSLEYARENDIPINSTEGFIRQIIGWREFIRGIYICRGSDQRTKNFWSFTRKIPSTFYDGTTGILPIDKTIKKVLKTGYCHHIERLMILGNFMLLCEFDPDEVYRWFMELFIDSYDWVMVPNVYGMSQFADGGLMATKPYISGSNYLMKMGNYKKEEWQTTWDGLFWRFMHVHRDFFLQNPRLGMLVGTFDKMTKEKRELHLNNADSFLSELDNM